MTGGSSARAATARRLFGVAQIIDGLEGSIGSNIVQHIILFRRTDPGELCPVKFDFGTGDQLIEVERGIESTQGQPVGFRNTVDVVCRYCSARARHILRDDIRISGYVLTDETRDVP